MTGEGRPGYRLILLLFFLPTALAILTTSGDSTAAAAPAPPAPAPVSLKAENRQPKGWGRDGWGSYRFVVENHSSSEATVVRWTAHWEAGGRTFGEPWGDEVNKTAPAGGQLTLDEVGVLPAAAADAARPRPPEMAGYFTVQWQGKDHDLPFRLPIPEAVLPEPLKLIRGKTVGMALMKSRYRQFHHVDRALHWLDQAYQRMIDLTGEHPFGGKLMVFREAPPHPWWAYAGKEMILNTDYVAGTLKDFDDGILAFGWVHEVGHNFDVLGDWYIFSGPAAEAQANFKLCYAVSTMPDQSFRMKWRPGPPTYAPHAADQTLTGPQMVRGYFLPFGDEYLADPKRSWDTLQSDDILSFYLRLQAVYGWDVFRQWYRTYTRLAAAGEKPPGTPEEKINLICAILSEETGQDLAPAFQLWRFPVTPESVKAAARRYHLPPRA